MESLIRWVSERTIPDTGLRAKFDREFRNIYGKLQDLRDAVTNLSVTSSTVTISTLTGSVNIRAEGSRAVVAGTNTITFLTQMTTATYALAKLRLTYASGEESDARVLVKTQTYFTCTCDDAGTLDYVAVEAI